MSISQEIDEKQLYDCGGLRQANLEEFGAAQHGLHQGTSSEHSQNRAEESQFVTFFAKFC